MKTTINLHDLLIEHVGPKLSYPSPLDIDTIFEFNDAVDDCDIDLDALLARHRIIARYWSTEDVLNARPDLTDDQAWEVLQGAEVRLACGSEDDTFDEIATELFGVAGKRACRLDGVLVDYSDGDATANLTELLADARHWCDHHESQFGQVDSAAYGHYLHELRLRDAKP
jgi:hypothetical protein